MNRIGQHQSVDALTPVRDQRFAAQDMRRKRVQHRRMLPVLPVRLDLHRFVGRRTEALLTRRAPLPLVHLQLLHDELAVLTDERRLRACNLQTVRAGGVGGRGDENARCAVRVLEIGGHVVLNLDVVPLALVAETLHLARQSHQPLHQIQLMRALVQQHTAAFARPRCAPCAGIVIELRAVPVGDNPIDTL